MDKFFCVLFVLFTKYFFGFKVCLGYITTCLNLKLTLKLSVQQSHLKYAMIWDKKEIY